MKKRIFSKKYKLIYYYILIISIFCILHTISRNIYAESDQLKPLSGKERKERLKNFVTDVDVYSESLKFMTEKYKTFLTYLAHYDSECDIDTEILKKKKTLGFGWISSSVIETCLKKLNDFKDYARRLGTVLDRSESLMKEIYQHAKTASRQLDRLILLERVKALSEEANKARIILQDAEERIDKYQEKN